jgi:hypothetical protein
MSSSAPAAVRVARFGLRISRAMQPCRRARRDSSVRGEPGVSVPRKAAARRLPSGGVMQLAHLPGDAVVPLVAARLLSAWHRDSRAPAAGVIEMSPLR